MSENLRRNSPRISRIPRKEIRGIRGIRGRLVTRTSDSTRRFERLTRLAVSVSVRGMSQKFPKTFGELRGSPYHALHSGGRTVKDEMRVNLLEKLRKGDTLFPGIVGYDETVVPQIINAILSKHNMILLGLRGQAKSR